MGCALRRARVCPSVALTCIAKMLLGRTSLCCLMLKCHVLILIMSSNMNSRYKRPSTQTLSMEERSGVRGHDARDEIQRLIWSDISPYLCEHGFAVLGHHGALVAVERHKVTVEGLLWVLQNVEQLGGPAFKNTPKVAWNQRPADGCRQTSEMNTDHSQRECGRLQWQTI